MSAPGSSRRLSLQISVGPPRSPCPGSSLLDTQSGPVPCTQLLTFLQRNIVIAAASVAGILVATGLLLLMLTIHSRRKRPL